MEDPRLIYRVNINGVAHYFDPFRVYLDARRAIAERKTTLERCLSDIQRITKDPEGNVLKMSEIPYELQGELLDCMEHLAFGAYRAFKIQPVDEVGNGIPMTEAFQMLVEFMTWQVEVTKKPDGSLDSSPATGGHPTGLGSIPQAIRESQQPHPISAAPNLSMAGQPRYPI